MNAERETGDSKVWGLLWSGARSAAENMAIDQVLLESAPESGKPVLRFYEWTEPAASFGYFQRYFDVAKMTRLRPLVRRPTGGGLVPHGADWTYSLIFPPGHSWYRLRAGESYRRLHMWIQGSFRKTGVDTELAGAARKEAAGQCFIGAEQFDLLWRARKVAGAAQRRTRRGLLIQGSIQPPPEIGKADWQESFCDVARAEWGIEWTPFELGADALSRSEEEARNKFSRMEYNQRR